MHLFAKGREPSVINIPILSMDRASQWTVTLSKVKGVVQASISIDGYTLLSAERQSVRISFDINGRRAAEDELRVISDTKVVLDDLYGKASSRFEQTNGGFSDTYGSRIFNVILETVPDSDNYCYRFGLRFEKVTQSQFTNTLHRICNVLDC